MASAIKINAGDSTAILTDIRVASGTDAPTDEIVSAQTGKTAENGDMYFQRTGNVQTSGIWNYVIGANGVCKCWCRVAVNTVSLNQGPWGDVYYRTRVVNGLKYPVTFKEKPVVFYTPYSDLIYGQTWASNFWLYSDTSDTADSLTYAPEVSFARYNGTASPQGTAVYYFVIGLVE